MGRAAVDLLLAGDEQAREMLVPMPVISRASIAAPARLLP
jgi:hypothetical protein